MSDNKKVPEEQEESRQVLGKTKRIKDATLYDANAKNNAISERFQTDKTLDIDVIEETGDKDAPPLEMDDEALQTISENDKAKDEFQKEVRSKTTHYNNGKNVWQLIAKTYNTVLDWEHVTTAMQIGEEGCLVCVKEAIGQKMHSTMTYVPGAVLELDANEKWSLL